MSGKGSELGHRARQLALGIMASGGVDAYRYSVLVDVSRAIGKTCNLTVTYGCQILFVDRVETEWPLRIQIPMGSRVPLYCTAIGKLYLSLLPAMRRHKFIKSLPMELHKQQTITDRKILSVEIEAIRRKRVGLNDVNLL